jgi:hypothetical protein
MKMLQMVTTLGSLLLAAGMLAVIAAILLDDWQAIRAALGLRRSRDALAMRSQPRQARRARIVSLRPQSAPRRVAA